jgi:hypothetical protein
MSRPVRRTANADSLTLFCTVDHCPIHWTDPEGITHACEAAIMHDGIAEAWTLCGKDVPADFAFNARHAERKLTCGHCETIEGHHHATALVLLG